MKSIDIKNIKTFLDENKNWVKIIDSGNPWKTLWIIALTHWNEPIWVKIFDWLLNKIKISEQIAYWRIVLIIWNYQAAFQDKRFIDNDFNRVWEDDYNECVETKRRDEIKKWVEMCDVVIDLHSTSNPSEIMVIPLSQNNETYKLCNKLESNYILKNIADKTKGISLTEYHSYLDKANISIAIECWEHWSKQYDEITKENIKRVINNTLKLNLFTKEINKKPEIYNLFQVIKAKSTELRYIYSDSPKSFDYIKAWNVICHNWENIICDKDSYIVMPSKKAEYIWFELFYLSNKE